MNIVKVINRKTTELKLFCTYGPKLCKERLPYIRRAWDNGYYEYDDIFFTAPREALYMVERGLDKRFNDWQMLHLAATPESILSCMHPCSTQTMADAIVSLIAIVDTEDLEYYVLAIRKRSEVLLGEIAYVFGQLPHRYADTDEVAKELLIIFGELCDTACHLYIKDVYKICALICLVNGKAESCDDTVHSLSEMLEVMRSDWSARLYFMREMFDLISEILGAFDIMAQVYTPKMGMAILNAMHCIKKLREIER